MLVAKRWELQDVREQLADALESRDTSNEASVLTQQNLKFHIESLVNEALHTIWGENAYTFKANFITRRNQLECVLRLVRNGVELNPLEAAGGGVCDVVSMAFRMVYHSLGSTIPVLLFDEPLRHLSPDMQKRAALMRNELRRLLGLQFIIITHEEESILGADRIFTFALHNGRTHIEMEENG
jgi:DNA repair exonuclease SbcCD ATPase subunit